MALQGSGTELDPYLVTSLAELRTEITDANAYYKVTQDLDVRGTQHEVEWEECTLAFLQLDFNNKKLRNLKCKDLQHMFLFDCDTMTIKNAKFENIENKWALFGHTSGNYTYILNLTILDSEFSVKWIAANTVPTATKPFALLGTPNTNVDRCVFNLLILGTTNCIINSELNINRSHFVLSGDFTLHGISYYDDVDRAASAHAFFKFKNIGNSLYITGNLIVTLASGSYDLYVFLNTRNTALYQYGNKAHFSECYFAVNLTVNAVQDTDNKFDMWRYQTTTQASAPPCSWMAIGDMIVNNGILTSLPNDYAKVYIITAEQARNLGFLQSIDFPVHNKE